MIICDTSLRQVYATTGLLHSQIGYGKPPACLEYPDKTPDESISSNLEEELIPQIYV